MQPTEQAQADQQFENWLALCLRGGVIVAAAVILCGAVPYLIRDASHPAGHHVFEGEPASLRTPGRIVANAAAGDRLAIMQLGLLVLIATPVMRVVLSVVAFARERDWPYVGFTLVVLTVLLFSLCEGYFR